MAELKALSTAVLMLVMLASSAVSIPAMGPAYGLGPSDYAPPRPQEFLAEVQQQGMLFNDPDISMEASLQASNCYQSLYILAFTSKLQHGDSDDAAYIEMQLVTGPPRHVMLYDRPGDDYATNKGDLWKIKLSDFGFSDSCITKSEVKKLVLVEGGNDGWHIDSVVTFLRRGSTFTLLSQNINAYRWLDGDQGIPLKRFELNIV